MKTKIIKYGVVMAVCILFFMISVSGAVFALIEAPAGAEKIGTNVNFDEFKPVLKIAPNNKYLQIEPGKSAEFEVNIKNIGSDEIKIEPKMVVPEWFDNVIEADWVTVTPETAVLKKDEKPTFKISVSIPKDTEQGSYNANIAFTNRTTPDEPGMGAPAGAGRKTYIDTFSLNVEVSIQPSVNVQMTYIDGLIESGKSQDYDIEIENTGRTPIPLSPKFGGCEESFDSYGYKYSGMPGEIKEEWVTMSSPANIPAKSKITVKITVSVPKDSKGSYSGKVCLNIKDPAFEGPYNYNMWMQEININLQTWIPPVEPFTKKFDVPAGAKEIELEVNNGESVFGYTSFYMRGGGNEVKEPDFNVSLINPKGIEVKPDVKEIKISGTVNLGALDYLPPWEKTGEGIYQDTGIAKSQTYIVKAEDGEWTLKIMPANTFSFSYGIDIKY